MTKDRIHQEARKPSKHWVEAGSGILGQVFVEVIGCNGLPNMDIYNISTQIAPDAFACLVYEDSIVNTDVIANTRSPVWTPWCRRAFVFNMSHPSSNVLLGLFHWGDPEKPPVQAAAEFSSDVHDPIARIVINVADSIPETTNTLTVRFSFVLSISLCFYSISFLKTVSRQYPLYFGNKSSQRRQNNRGTITVRFRVVLYNSRKAMIVGMKPPKPTVISVATEYDFAMAHYTTE
jgi:hypothetical protein